MPRPPNNPGLWPPVMRAATAAAYMDEQSVEAFLRRVGSDYPTPDRIKGRGAVWYKSELDRVIEQRSDQRSGVAGQSLADDL